MTFRSRRLSLCLSGYKMNEFNWENYLESCNAQAAPKNLFKSQNSVSAQYMRRWNQKEENASYRLKDVIFQK